MRLELWGVVGLPEVRAGDDLAAMVAAAEPRLADGDVLVVTSKVVSKAEGRALLAADREAAIDTETVDVVARRGPLRIVRDRRGLVMAAAGVDASNAEPGTVLLLPVDPDASARAIRDGVRDRLGVDVAVVVSDSFGRPWRHGLTDVAIGVAGMAAVVDLRGQADSSGTPLEVTEIAVADEIAAAADLVKGKLAGVPVAVLRGLALPADDGRGSAPLIRPAGDDLFRLGTAEAFEAGRRAGLEQARSSGCAAPARAGD